MLLSNIASYKLEGFDLEDGTVSLMRDDSNGEGIDVIAKVESDWAGNVGCEVETISCCDSVGEEMFRCNADEISNISELQAHLEELFSREESVVDELVATANREPERYEPCEMTVAKEYREKREFSMVSR